MDDSNPQLNDVVASFKKIRAIGDYLAANDGDNFSGNRYDMMSFNNHFQGIQRLYKENYCVISGGDPEEGSHLFVVKMGSRRNRGAWCSSLLNSELPPEEDTVSRVILVDPVATGSPSLWHAGGLSLLGDILAVPIERSKKGAIPEKSEIRFFNFHDPEKVEAIGEYDGAGGFSPTIIEREGVKAGAAALTKLPSGHFLAVVWSYSDSSKDKHLDLYLSHSTVFTDGFHQDPLVWIDKKPPKKLFEDYQAINLVCEAPANEDGSIRLFLVGLHNDSPYAPIVAGRDLVDLFELIFPREVLYDPNPQLDALPKIKKRGQSRLFRCEHRQCNMDAAAGIYIDKFETLNIYSSYHWRSNGIIRFNEYRTPPENRPPITQRRDSWIDLYERGGFKGRCLSLVGTRDANIPDYSRIRVQGGAFDNVVSSIRFQIPTGHTYELYELSHYNRYQPARKVLKLEGSGVIQEIPSLRNWDKPKGFNDKASSSRFAQP
jgi:hypothetical protein